MSFMGGRERLLTENTVRLRMVGITPSPLPVLNSENSKSLNSVTTLYHPYMEIFFKFFHGLTSIKV
jgi:hypothetical protein